MLRQLAISHNLYTYELEPGDDTVYRFGFLFPSNGELVKNLTTKDSPEHEVINGYIVQVSTDIYNITHVTPASTFSGLGNGKEYILFYIESYSYHRMTYIEKWTLNNLANYVYRDIISRMPNIDKYTVIAVLHALQVLTKDPANLEGACRAILTAGLAVTAFSHDHDWRELLDDDQNVEKDENETPF